MEPKPGNSEIKGRENPKSVAFRDKDGRVLPGQLYTREGPHAGLSLLTWGIVGPTYEMIERKPMTDVVIAFADGDFAKISLQNPEDITTSGDSAVREANKGELHYSLTNVAMQAGDTPSGIELPADAVENTALRIEQPLTLRSEAFPNGNIQNASSSPITQILLYDRRREVPASLVGTPRWPETSLVDEFRQAIQASKAAKGLGGSALAAQ